MCGDKDAVITIQVATRNRTVAWIKSDHMLLEGLERTYVFEAEGGCNFTLVDDSSDVAETTSVFPL